MTMVEAPAVAGWPPDDVDGGSDDEVDRRSVTSASTIFCGDCIVSEHDPDDMAAVAAANREHAASRDEGDAQPRERIHKRRERPRRDTAPKQTPQEKTKWATRNNAGHVGNIGWLFGNWGKRPKCKVMRQHLDEVLKKQPAMVIGLAECQAESEEVLRSEPAAVAASADAEGQERRFEDRPGYQYITIRGDEEDSVLIGVREESGNTLELLDWERREWGRYRRRSGGKEKAIAYSRSMTARVTTWNNVGFLGKEHQIMVVHMNNQLANAVFGTEKLREYWDWLWDKIERFRVQVLMGDFNMSLFRVIPELRSRGAVIDLSAWYPWKSLKGEPMSDSCGIFS